MREASCAAEPTWLVRGSARRRWRMPKKRPCCICRKWFRPDPRVGDRQKACGKPECQGKRRQRTQSRWRSRNPDYFRARWLRERSRQAEEAAEGRPASGGEARRRPAPMRARAELRTIPWDVVQDEIGVQVTDTIGLLGKVLIEAMQDQRRSQHIDSVGDPSTLQQGADQDQIPLVPP